MKKLTGYQKVIPFRKGLMVLFINMIRITVLRILYRSDFTSTNVVIKHFQALSDDSLVISTNPYNKILVQYKELGQATNKIWLLSHNT